MVVLVCRLAAPGAQINKQHLQRGEVLRGVGPRYIDQFPTDYNYISGKDRPFAPSLAKTSTGSAFDARRLAGSRSCGTALHRSGPRPAFVPQVGAAQFAFAVAESSVSCGHGVFGQEQFEVFIQQPIEFRAPASRDFAQA